MRILGHPIHPMLVHFPIVLWTVAAAAYVAAAVGMQSAAMIAKFSNGAGLVMALLAMVAGLLELTTIDSHCEAMQVATWHLMVMATAWLLFVLALVLPLAPASSINASAAQFGAAACACVGFVAMGAGGWLGGQLVYDFGVGVKGREKP